jgi:hypothetical protein
MIKAKEWDISEARVEFTKDKMKEMRSVKPKVRSIPTVSEPPVEAPFKARRRFDMSKTKLAKYQTTKLLSPLADKDHSMRVDMFINQFDNMVMPINTEVPYLSSAFYGDMLSRSSCIYKARGKVKLLHKFMYQRRKIYIYELNGKYELLDTNGLINNNGVCCIQHTDLDLLEPNKEYDIKSDDENFCIEYPDQYIPHMDIVKYGRNVAMINTIDKDTADDSCKISDKLAADMGCIKIKTVNIPLENKILKSDFSGKIPPIGQILDESIIFKVSEQEEEDLAFISQSTDTPVGLEDTQIVIEPNSYIGYFEVTANEPIEDDPILEAYRQEYLEFRNNVASALRPLIVAEREKCSDKVIAYYENFIITKFRTEKKALTCPFLRMEIITLDFASIGVKLSNGHGCKATAQEIFPHGSLVAEDGTPIEMVFSVSAHVARSITGVLWEQWLTGFSLYLTRKYKTLEKKTEKNSLIKDYRKVLDLFNLNEAHKDFTDEQIDMLLSNYPCLPIAVVPYEQRIDMESADKAMNILSKWGFAEQTIWKCDENGNRIRPLTDKHLVGSIYTIRDIHDPEYQNSSIAEVTLTTKGVPEEKSKTKRDAQSVHSKKATKMDVQLTAHLTGMINDADLYQMQIAGNQKLHSLPEYLNAIGFAIEWKDRDE